MEGLVASPTAQQLAVRASAQALRNLRVCAHAGAGKTTTLLWAVGQLPPASTKSGVAVPRRVLFLEYNRDLRLEAKERAKAAGLNNVVVHNYDSFLVEYYDPAAPSHDFQLALRKVLAEDVVPLKSFGFETLVVDEVQDMTEPYRDFVLKILRDNDPLSKDVQLILAGDPKQTIYGFRGARAEYLLSPQEDWIGSSDGYPDLLTLGKTFRFGPAICGFVNDLCRNTFLKESWIKDIEAADSTSGGNVEFWEIEDSKEPDALVKRYCEALDGPGTTAVISASLREENVHLGRFVEACSARDRVPLEGGDDDDENDDESSFEHHATLRTVHTSKGKQYDTVFLFLVQGGQWLTPTGRLKTDKATVLYVSATRARKNLVVVQDEEDRVAERVWAAASRQARWRWGAPRLASSGLPRSVCAPPPTALRQVPWVQPSDVFGLEKNLDAARKEELMEGLSYQIHRFAEEIPVSPPTALEELALFLRALPSGTSPVAPLEIWARGSRAVNPEVAYARLACGPCPSHRYLAQKFGKAIDELSHELNSWGDWFTLASFHPSRRYGHARVRGEVSPRADLCEEMRSRCTQMTTGAIFVEESIANETSCSVCSPDHIFFVEKSIVILPIFASTEGTRPFDVFAASIAAHRLRRSVARIDYLHRGVSVRISGNFAALDAETTVSRRWSGGESSR